MCGGGGTPPAPPTAPAPPPEPARPVDESVQQSRKAEKKRLAQSRGRQSTIVTGARGLLDEANTATVSLLGQP